MTLIVPVGFEVDQMNGNAVVCVFDIVEPVVVTGYQITLSYMPTVVPRGVFTPGNPAPTFAEVLSFCQVKDAPGNPAFPATSRLVGADLTTPADKQHGGQAHGGGGGDGLFLFCTILKTFVPQDESA